MTSTTLKGVAATVQGSSKASFATPVIPMLNPLNDFRSVNYNFTLSVLNIAQYNDPLSSYKGPNGELGRIILQSGSGDPSNRVSISLPTTTGPASNQYDFYIDDVRFEGIFGLNVLTGNTTATRITFVVTEPLSMGLFFVALQQAAIEQKFSNWIDAPFLLTLKFRGYDEDNEEFPVPDCTRHFPIKFSNIDMKVSSAGAIYECEAYSYNDFCHTPDIVTLKEDVTLQGNTVVDILQSGHSSLQDVINDQLDRMNYVSGSNNNADSVRIIFPVDNADPFDFTKLYQSDSDLNSIARSGLSIENYSGTSKVNNDKFTEGTNSVGHRVLTRDLVTLDTTAGSLTFGHGSSIIDAINQVMIISQYGKSCASQIGNTGDKILWWKIDTQVFFNPPGESGDVSRVYVYRVIQYSVDASAFAPSGTKLPVYPPSRPVKSYDYIFTGKNIDILDLDLSYNATFRQAAFADYNGVGNTSRITRLTDQQQRKLQAVDQISSGNLDFLLNPGVPAPSFQYPLRRNSRTPLPVAPLLSPILPVKTLPVSISTPSYYRGGVMTSYNETGTTNGDTTTKYVRQLYTAMLAGNDMISVELRIRGDVYYLGDSMGNYVSKLTDNDNVNRDMQINQQSSDNFININYKTPIDLDQSTGLYTQLADLQTFSGMYRVLTVDSTFKNGVFEQRLSLSRRQGQVIPNSPAPSIIERAVEPPSGKDFSNYA